MGSLQKKKTELALALDGRVSEHFRWLLHEYMDTLERLDGKLDDLNERLNQKMEPHADLLKRLGTIPGANEVTARALIAELGVDMSQFGSAGQAASWARLCPGQFGERWQAYVGQDAERQPIFAADSHSECLGSDEKGQPLSHGVVLSIAQRRGMKKAAVAVAHRILILAY